MSMKPQSGQLHIDLNKIVSAALSQGLDSIKNSTGEEVVEEIYADISEFYTCEETVEENTFQEESKEETMEAETTMYEVEPVDVGTEEMMYMSDMESNEHGYVKDLIMWGNRETKFLVEMHDTLKDYVGPLKKFPYKKNLWACIAQEIGKRFSIKPDGSQVEGRYKSYMKQKGMSRSYDADQLLDEAVKSIVKNETGYTPEKPKKKEAMRWGMQETKFLMSLYSQLLKFVGPTRRFKKKKHLWAFIATEIGKRFPIKPTPMQTETRYKVVQGNSQKQKALKSVPYNFEEVIEGNTSDDDAFSASQQDGMDETEEEEEAEPTYEEQEETVEHAYSTPGKQGGKTVWSKEEIKWMMDLYKALEPNVGPYKRFRTKKSMWEHIAAEMGKRFDFQPNYTQVEAQYKASIRNGERKAYRVPIRNSRNKTKQPESEFAIAPGMKLRTSNVFVTDQNTSSFDPLENNAASPADPLCSRRSRRYRKTVQEKLFEEYLRQKNRDADRREELYKEATRAKAEREKQKAMDKQRRHEERMQLLRELLQK